MHHSAVSAGLVAKVVLVAAAVVGGIFFVYLTREVVGLLVIAVFFALAIAPAVGWLDRRRVPRWLAILLVYLGIAGVIFGIGLLLVPPLVDGINDLSEDLPGYVDDLRENETFREYDDRYDITERLQEQAEELPSQLGEAAGALRDVTVEVFTSFIQLFAILVITFFLLIYGERMLAFAYREVSDDRARRLRVIAGDVSDALAGYVFGNFVISVLAGLVTYVTLTLLDVPFAVPLAILFAFLDLVPLVGATLGGILVGIVVAFVSFPVGLIVWAGVMILYQQVENHLIQPLVYGRTVALNPLIVIVAILIGASLLGVLGALIAIPVAATVQAVVRDYWRFYKGEEPPEPEGRTPPDAGEGPAPEPRPEPAGG